MCYGLLNQGLEAAFPYIDRDVYPEAEFPAGQWEYQLYYQEQFDQAIAPFDANPYNMVKALFRKGNPTGKGKPSLTAYVRKQQGWFGGASEAPDIPMDGDVVTEEDLRFYSDALERNGFFGPCSYYMNTAQTRHLQLTRRMAGGLICPCCFCTASTTLPVRR